MIKNRAIKTLPSGMLDEHVRYALTLSPSMQYDDPQYSKVRAHKETYYAITHFVHLLRDTCSILLVPEISKAGRWHYHGLLNIKNTYSFHAEVLPRLRGICKYEIDVINDPDIWKEYMYKDRKYMEPALTSQGVPYELTSDTPQLPRMKHKLGP